MAKAKTFGDIKKHQAAIHAIELKAQAARNDHEEPLAESRRKAEAEDGIVIRLLIALSGATGRQVHFAKSIDDEDINDYRGHGWVNHEGLFSKPEYKEALESSLAANKIAVELNSEATQEVFRQHGIRKSKSHHGFFQLDFTTEEGCSKNIHALFDAVLAANNERIRKHAEGEMQAVMNLKGSVEKAFDVSLDENVKKARRDLAKAIGSTGQEAAR